MCSKQAEDIQNFSEKVLAHDRESRMQVRLALARIQKTDERLGTTIKSC